ncbi:MAG: PhzF family phenazine biosynthesis protein, partial [Firmicutes bacterium]|nr:PhzF family phenazine biosynthesis protein [Bacillota bacterium]
MKMKPYTVDAFTSVPFGGNPAGVVLIDGEYPADSEMLAVAAELGYSETAFIRPGDPIQIRYFTPVSEVDLCGHATVASVHVLKEWGRIEALKPYLVRTKAGDINVDIDESGTVWMDMAPPASLGIVGDADALYGLFGIVKGGVTLPCERVTVGLADIMMPVESREVLNSMVPDLEGIKRFTGDHGVISVHAFAPGDGEATAYVRDFAPICGINEEAATGTANGALTFYLYERGLVKPGEINLFIQGEAMGRPSEVRTVVLESESGAGIRVGGKAVFRP